MIKHYLAINDDEYFVVASNGWSNYERDIRDSESYSSWGSGTVEMRGEDGDSSVIYPTQRQADTMALALGGYRLCRLVTGVRTFREFLLLGDIDKAKETLLALEELAVPFSTLVDDHFASRLKGDE